MRSRRENRYIANFIYVRLYFFIRDNFIIKKKHYGPGVDSASNRNEYQEYLKIKKPGG
jgi:hypothetical protein